jgi:uncharacterized protein YecA (UPF0149 family)
MSQSVELLKALDIIIEDLTPEHISKLDEIAKTLGDPAKMKLEDAMKIVNDVGLDIEKLQKNARKKRAEELEKNRRPRVGANEQCPCGHGKKFKKCCRFK